MMRSNWVRATALGIVSTAILGCSETATEPRHTDVDLARSVWLTSHPQAYSFEVATASSWFPSAGYYRVRVSNGQVISATDPTGKPVANFTLTVDTIWDYVLAARARGELNSAVFNQRGIPVEADMGPWAVDGGVRYSVRNFTQSD
jgi:uncharacterized protein DUF6174